MDSKCPQCGALPINGLDCRQQFEALLALEYQDPTGYGAAHHLLVMSYVLQHPDEFTDQALEWERHSLKSALDGLPPSELRKQAGKSFNGQAHVKKKTPSHPPGWPAQWPLTVSYIYAAIEKEYNTTQYIELVKTWAGSIIDTLK